MASLPGTLPSYTSALPCVSLALPLQVVLDTVELVLSAADDEPPPTPMTSASALSEAGSRQALADEEAAAAAAGGGGAGAGWFGSALQSLALRAGLNVTGAAAGT